MSRKCLMHVAGCRSRCAAPHISLYLLISPYISRLQVEVCGSRRFLLDGWWEDHCAASGLNFGFSPRALLAWAHSWTAHLEEEEPHSPPRSRRKEEADSSPSSLLGGLQP